MKLKNLLLVKVSSKHRDLLFNWRNEENTVKNSINNKPVKYYVHKKWFRKRLGIKPTLFWILKKRNFYLGTIRLDKKTRRYFLSYSIDEKFRGRGYGSKIIREMLRKKIIKNILNKGFEIFAVVKKENQASVKAILSNNFYKISANKKTYKLKYLNQK